MEWDTVVLLDDFAPAFTSAGNDEEHSAEANLLYVAVTRTQRQLVLNPASFFTLLHVDEKRERFVSTGDHLAANPAAVCFSCKKPLAERASSETSVASLRVPSTRLNCGTTFLGGVLCPVCSAVPFYVFPVLPRCIYTGRSDSNVPKWREDYAHRAFAAFVGPCGEERALAAVIYAYESELAKYGLKQHFNRFQVSQEVIDLSDEEEDVEDVVEIVEMFQIDA